MKPKVAVYNMEWTANLYTNQGESETAGKDGERSTLHAKINGGCRDSSEVETQAKKG